MNVAGSPRARGAAALLLWLVVMAIAVSVIARGRFDTDLSAFLPARPDAQQRLLIEQLQDGVAARTLLVGIEGGDAAQRAAASRRLAAAMRESGRFEHVQNGDRGSDREASDWRASADWVVAHRYQLSPAANAERYSVAGLRDAIDETLSLLGTPAGQAVKPLLERDPTGETQRIVEGLIPSSAPRSEEGVWAGRGTPRALLLATTRAPGADLDAMQASIAVIRDAFEARAVPGEAGLSLQLSGPGVFSVLSRERIEREVKQLAAVGVLVMGGLLLLAFASLRALLVAMLPVLTGIAFGVAAVMLAFGSVHGITLAFGSTLIGEAVDYAIYYLIQARPRSTEDPAGSGWRRWRDDNWPTVRLGLLTSVCGFAALLFSGFPGLAQLGAFSVAGLCGAALATRWLLPQLLPDGAGASGLRASLGRIAGRPLRALPHWRPLFLVLGVAAALLLVLRDAPLWRGDLGSLSPVPRAQIELDESLRADLGAGDARTLVVATAPDQQAALRAAEAATVRLDALVAQGLLAGYETPTRILPSIATQQARLASLPEADLLRARLVEATAGGPLKVERLQPFIADAQAARGAQPVTRDDLPAGPLVAAVDAQLVVRPGTGWSVLMPLTAPPAAADGVDTGRVREALRGLDGVDAIDIGGALRGLYANYLHEAFVQTALGALAVVALLAAWLRSGRRLLAVCQPLALALLLTLGGLALFDVALGILHLVGLLLVVAVGSNYALFFDQLGGAVAADDDTLASLLLANLTTVASFGLIALSEIPALSAIGRVVAPGALLALLLSAAFASAPRPGPP